MGNSFPSRAVCIAGSIVLATGLGGLVSLAAGLFQDRFGPNVAVVGIPIGYGILVGWNNARRWAVFLAGLGLVVDIGFAGWEIVQFVQEQRPFYYPARCRGVRGYGGSVYPGVARQNAGRNEANCEKKGLNGRIAQLRSSAAERSPSLARPRPKPCSGGLVGLQGAMYTTKP